MSNLLFYSIAAFILVGCILLLTTRSQTLRLVSCLAIVGGLGLLGLSSGLWLSLVFAAIAILVLLYFFFQGRSSQVNSEDEGRGIRSSATIRTIVAGVVAAGVAGILLSIVWTHPIWNQSQTPHSISSSPALGFWLALFIPLVLGLLLAQGKRSDDCSEEPLGGC